MRASIQHLGGINMDMHDGMTATVVFFIVLFATLLIGLFSDPKSKDY